MRVGVPSPAELRGRRFWTTATIRTATVETVLPVGGGSWLWKEGTFPSVQLSGVVVPRMVDGTDLLESGQVGRDGHRISIDCHVAGRGEAWDWNLGDYIITSVDAEDARLVIDAADETLLVGEHDLAVPRPVHPGDTITEVVRRIMQDDRISLWVDPRLPRPRVPRGFTVGTDRAAALKELLTAWGAFLFPRDGRQIAAWKLPDQTITERPQIALYQGAVVDGIETVADAPIRLARDEIFNHVVVGVQGSARVVQAVQRDGLYSVDGMFGWRTLRIDSDAVDRVAQAQIVALAELGKNMRQAVTVPIESIPDWRIEPLDAVDVKTEAISGWGRVTGFDFPLVDGTAVFDVGMES